MSAYDKYFVQRGAANHLKFRRLTVPERGAFFLGILSIAAGAEPRGRLLVGNHEATADDVAHEANVPVAAARSAMAKLEDVGMLIRDNEPGLLVHDWEDYQPAPKRKKPSDSPEAARERKQRQRERERVEREARMAGATCAYCGTSEDLTEDHVIPRSKGGTDDADNVVWACGPCNSSKRDRPAPSRHVVTRVTSRGHAPEVEEEVEGEVTAPIGAMDQSAPAPDTAIGGNGLHVVEDAA